LLPFKKSEQTMDSSTSSSSHYASLLNTVSDLRTDLEKTMNKIHALEEQNQNLTNNYQTVKEDLVETRKKFVEAKENYIQTVSEKLEAERQYESFMDRLKTQLIEKTKDFEQIRDKLVPHDIDQLRIKVQEELEINHKQQLLSLEQEIERQREQFFSSRREFERSKTEYEILIQNQQQELIAIRQEREEVEISLRQQSLQQSQNNEYWGKPTNKDEKIRTQKAKINELNHLNECLKEEARACRKEKDESLLWAEQLSTKREEETVSLFFAFLHFFTFLN
jgi:predicted  nucleic acid-binding Zn-ribbon protein